MSFFISRAEIHRAGRKAEEEQQVLLLSKLFQYSHDPSPSLCVKGVVLVEVGLLFWSLSLSWVLNGLYIRF